MQYGGSHDRSFWVADIRPTGDMHACLSYTYPLLERVPGCSDLIVTLATELYRNPSEFHLKLTEDLFLRFSAAAETSAIATLIDASGNTVSISLLLCGLDPTSDSITIGALQKRLVRELHDTPHEPGFGLSAVADRPLIATIALADPSSPSSRVTAAIADRCLGAAYFRYHRLA